jgi:hypothetical protein
MDGIACDDLGGKNLIQIKSVRFGLEIRFMDAYLHVLFSIVHSI